MTQQAKRPPAALSTEETDFKEQHTAQDPADLPIDLEQFIAECSGGGGYTAKLYQVKAEPHKKGSHILLGEYENHVPTDTEVGQENGAGMFEIMVYYRPKKNGPVELKTRRFILGDRWNFVKDEYYAARGKTPPAPSAVSTLEDQLRLTKMMVETFAPLMQARPGGDPTTFMASLMDLQGKMLSQSFSQQMQTQDRVVQTLESARLKMADESGAEMETDAGTITTIIDMLKGLAPLLAVTPRAAAADVTRSTLAMRPDLRQIVDNSAQRAAIISKVKSGFRPNIAKRFIQILDDVSGEKRTSGGNGKKDSRPKAAGKK